MLLDCIAIVVFRLLMPAQMIPEYHVLRKSCARDGGASVDVDKGTSHLYNFKDQLGSPGIISK